MNSDFQTNTSILRGKQVVAQLIVPVCLILMGFLIYFVNKDPSVHIGLRGLPWLDVPTAFVCLGVLFILVKLFFRRRVAVVDPPDCDEEDEGSSWSAPGAFSDEISSPAGDDARLPEDL